MTTSGRQANAPTGSPPSLSIVSDLKRTMAPSMREHDRQPEREVAGARMRRELRHARPEAGRARIVRAGKPGPCCSWSRRSRSRRRSAMNIRPDQKSRSLLIFNEAPRSQRAKPADSRQRPRAAHVWFTPSAMQARVRALLPGRGRAQHFVERGHAFGDLHRAGQSQRPQAVLQRLLAQLALVAGSAG